MTHYNDSGPLNRKRIQQGSKFGCLAFGVESLIATCPLVLYRLTYVSRKSFSEVLCCSDCRKLLDAATVLLEGGDEGDVAHLSDLDYVLEEKKEETYEADIKTEEDQESDEEDKKPANLGLLLSK